HRHLRSFPTRRSSDLTVQRLRDELAGVESSLRVNDEGRRNVLRNIMRGTFDDEQARLANLEVAEERDALLARQAELTGQIATAEDRKSTRLNSSHVKI